MAKRTRNQKKPALTLTPFQRKVAEEFFDGRFVQRCGGTRAEIQQAMEELVGMNLFEVFLHLLDTCDVVEGEDESDSGAKVIRLERE